MNAQPSQETVKPEPVTQQDKDLLYQLRSISPKPEDPNGLVWSQYYAIAAYRRAATQKLEADKAQLKRDIAARDAVCESSANLVNELGANITTLRSQLEGMTKVLGELVSAVVAHEGFEEADLDPAMAHNYNLRYARIIRAIITARSALTTQPQHDAVFDETAIKRAQLGDEETKKFKAVSTRRIVTDDVTKASVVCYVHPDGRVMIDSVLLPQPAAGMQGEQS